MTTKLTKTAISGTNHVHPRVQNAARLSVAPMMDWTDHHCRYFHRKLSGQALLYTEMVTSPALVRGGAMHLLDHDVSEHPVALQLGGSEYGCGNARYSTVLCYGFALCINALI
jgi:hypothetical protein